MIYKYFCISSIIFECGNVLLLIYTVNVNLSIRRLKQAMYCAHAFIQTKLLCVYTESHLWLKKKGQMLRFLCAPRRRYFFSAAVKDGGFGAVSHTWVACGLLHTLVRSAWSASSSWRRRGGTEAVALIGWSRADGDPFYWGDNDRRGGNN